jgi:hypothetical protein
MARYLLEVSHDNSMEACTLAVELFLGTGSHFLTKADWGCLDGDHRSWAIVEADTKDQARGVLPTALRPNAKVIKLNTFTPEQLDQMRGTHKAS